MSKPTFIDGIASSEAIDTAGEIVSLSGLDCSSLIGAPFNWEHKNDQPAQIVGKILESHKIFSKDDCQNDRHLMYWNRCQTPFLYVKGRLFDDKKPSAVEVAALFNDDSEHPNEPKMMGFSVEGSKIEKKDVTITRSIARKITITATPANKTCIAEVVPSPIKDKSNDNFDNVMDNIKEIFKHEDSYQEIMEKKEKELKKDVGAGGGAFIGSQMAMHEHEELSNSLKKGMGEWSSPHSQMSGMGQGVHFTHPTMGKLSITKNPKTNQFDVHHNKQRKGSFANAKDTSNFAAHYMKQTTGLKLNKALDAGSMMVAPSALSGGAALGKESMDKKMHKKEKSKWYSRAHDAYNSWDKKDHFKAYMKKRMPHLADGEIDAIGKVLALKKNLQAENKLSKMYASYFGKNEMEKGSDIMMASEEYVHGLPKSHPALIHYKGHISRRTAPPRAHQNTWTWKVRSPEGKEHTFEAPAHTAGAVSALHQHIDSLAPKKS